MCSLFNKLPDPLKVQHKLDCINADTNYWNIYSHIYVIFTYLIVIYPLQNTKSNFPKFCKFMHSKNKNIYIHLYKHLVETFALILNSKIVFKKLLWLKLLILKNTLDALNPLIPGGNKRSHILKSKPTPFSCRFV